MKNHKIAITLSPEDFSKLEEIRKDARSRRSKSHQIAWLIKNEWELFQEEDREKTRVKTPTELLIDAKINALRYEKISASRSAKKAADYIEPCHDTRIIQFPVRHIRQFSGSA
jgi:hypothetical protein